MLNVLTYVKNKSFINVAIKKMKFQNMFLIIFVKYEFHMPSSEKKIHVFFKFTLVKSI